MCTCNILVFIVFVHFSRVDYYVVGVMKCPMRGVIIKQLALLLFHAT